MKVDYTFNQPSVVNYKLETMILSQLEEGDNGVNQVIMLGYFSLFSRFNMAKQS